VDLVLEGGSLHTNGQGLGITTTSCLLEPKRNPQYSKKEIESIIKDHLYLHELLWLPDGIDGDKDTDGHIDNFACFIDPQTLILQKPNENDAQGLALYKKNLVALQQMKERTNFQWVEGPTAPLLIDNG